MSVSNSSRILATPTSFAKNNFLYVQEVGSLQSVSPHISRRDNLESFSLWSPKGVAAFPITDRFSR